MLKIGKVVGHHLGMSPKETSSRTVISNTAYEDLFLVLYIFALQHLSPILQIFG